MRIGIYKPGKKIYFHENEEDHASWSPEIVSISKLFVEHGHSVYILSETDLIENEIPRLFIGFPTDKLHKVFVFNGVWNDTMSEAELLAILHLHTYDISFILSDMRLMTNSTKDYRRIFTQSKRLYDYGAIQEHCLLTLKTEKMQMIEKSIPYYFGGTERGRTNDFFEYVYRPNCTWYGKSESLGVVNYIPHDKHLEMLKAAKTTIIIADEEYNKHGFVNDRYYECAKYDVICFMDSKCDPDELIMKKKDWRRVSSYVELLKKQKMLDSDPILYTRILTLQQQELSEKASCQYLYQYLMK